MKKLIVFMAMIGTLSADKKAKPEQVVYPTSATIPASCDSVWSGAVGKLAARGFAPTQSDRAGGILWLRYVNGGSTKTAQRDAESLTIFRHSFRYPIVAFQVASAILSVATEGQGCRASVQIEYHADLGDGWVRLQTNGYLESLILADLEK